MGLPEFEYEHCDQSTSEHQQNSSLRRRYLLMAGIFGVVLVISAVIIAVVTLNYQEEHKCMSDLTCTPIKDCEGQYIDDITFPCGANKICCKSKLSTRTEIDAKTNSSERLKKKAKLMSNDCGAIPLDNKISDGENATLGKFPWMAALAYSSTITPGDTVLDFRCGGTLITDKYVLTAAHCVDDSLSIVFLGTLNLENAINNITECIEYNDGEGTKFCAYAEKIVIKKKKIHPAYNNTSYKNDIALLELERKVPKNSDFIKTICLPFEMNIEERLHWKNFTFTISGWGLIEHNGGISNILQHVAKIEPWKYQRCIDKITQRHLLPITQKQLCATGQNFTEACKGDSGGPLTFISDVATQIGIVSFKSVPNCGTERHPTVFTRIDGYLDWILDNIDI